MGALAIVEAFDVVKDLALGLGAGVEAAAINQLEFEGAPEAFDGSIVVAVAFATHGGNQAGLVASMSRKGNCYDNASIESFWSTLKLELVYRRSFNTRAQAQREIFDYIESFYNRQRSHSALDYRSPVDFENQNN